MRWFALLAFVACGGDKDDGGTTDPIELMCEGEGEPAVFLGEGVGGAFEELQDGAQVGLIIAPQGGFGVDIQVRTTGLKTEIAPIVTVRTEIDGEEDAAFTFVDPVSADSTQYLFCKDDGRGALGAGIAVGFNKDTWNQDNLTDLDGVVADLIVEIEDDRGVKAVGRKTVTIVIGG